MITADEARRISKVSEDELLREISDKIQWCADNGYRGFYVEEVIPESIGTLLRASGFNYSTPEYLPSGLRSASKIFW